MMNKPHAIPIIIVTALIVLAIVFFFYLRNPSDQAPSWPENSLFGSQKTGLGNNFDIIKTKTYSQIQDSNWPENNGFSNTVSGNPSAAMVKTKKLS